jgi:hypothetical protein
MTLELAHRLESETPRPADAVGADVPERKPPGKHTQVELFELLERGARLRRRAPNLNIVAPGRRTLIDRARTARLRFDDFRALALKDLLECLGPDHPLRRDVLNATDGTGAPGSSKDAARDGQAMWQAAERHAVTLCRRAADAGDVDERDPAITAALEQRGGGRPLPDELAREIEADLGISLAQVRVHTDAIAAAAARAARAEAFTVGEDIFFAEGAFAPETSVGRELLIHELAHVAQTLRGRADAPRDGVQVTRPGDAVEREAEDIARLLERSLTRRREQRLADETADAHSARQAARSPARQAARLDELRATGLGQMLRAASAHGGQPLVDATLAQADPDIVRAAPPSPAGRAMWRATERYTATLYRRAADAGEVDKDHPAVEAALQRCGCGQPLPPAVRRKMQDQLGVSLERVRIHTDQVAADAARAVHAEAFTVGEDIFFAEGAFAPDSPAGQRLLAHELTHVLQAWQGRTRGDDVISKPGDSLEREADTVADRVADRIERGEPVREAGAGGPAREQAEHAGRADRAEPAHIEPAPRAASAARVEPAPRERPMPAPAPAPLAPAQTPGSLALLRRAAPGAPGGAPGGQPRGRVPDLKGGAKPLAREATRDMQGLTADFTNRADGAATQATTKLKAGLADAKSRPPGPRADEVVKGDRRKGQADEREARALEQRQRDKARARASADPDVREPVVDKKGAPASRSPVKFKPITDWSKYMPQPLPDQDERERKRIEGLVKKKVEGERSQAQQGLEQLRQAHLQQAAEVRAMKPKLQAQVAAAQQQALAHVSATEGSQCAAVQGHVAGVRGQVQGHASSMKGQVTSAHAAAVAKINATYQAAIKKLTDGKTKALDDVTSAESTALFTLALDFLRLKGRFTTLGGAKAADAITTGEQEAGNMSGRWDGEKLEAAQKAARDTADGFATSMPDQAMGSYDKIVATKPEAEKALRDFAKTTRDNINKTFDQSKQALDTAKTQSIQAADTAKNGAIAQIDQSCASTVASLSAHGASQVAAIRKQGQGARTGITSAGAAARAAVAQTVDQAVAGIEGGVTGLIRGAAQVEAPTPEETQQQVQQGAASLEQGTTSVAQGLNKSTTAQSQGLTQQASTAAEGMTSTATSANAAATQIGAGAKQGMTQMASGASDGLGQIATGHKTQTDGTVTATEKGFTEQVTALGTAYTDAATQRQTQFDESYNSTKSGMDQAVPDQGGGGGGRGSGKKEEGGEGGGGAAKGEVESIRENAQKAADAVKPWWQKALAVVVSIVVAIVVVIVVTALIATTGPVGAILVGAAAGALASVAGTMASNLVLGNGLFDGITWKTIAIGAIGGGLGAGLTAGLGAGASALANSARFAGTALGRGAQASSAALTGTGSGLSNLAIKTGMEFATDVVSEQAANLIITGKLDLSVENLVLSLVTNAATGSPKFEALSGNLQAGIQNRTGFSLNVPRLQISIGRPPAPTGGAPGGAPPGGGPGPAPGGPGPAARGPGGPPSGPQPGGPQPGPAPRPTGDGGPAPGGPAPGGPAPGGPAPGGPAPGGPRPGDTGGTPRPGEGGQTPRPGDGDPARPPQGDRPPQGEGDRPPQGEGDRPPQGEGDRPPQGEGDRPPQGEGDRPPQGEGDRPPQGEGDRPPQGQGDRPPQGEGDRPPQGEGDRPPQDGDPSRPPQDGDPSRPPQDGDPSRPPQDGDPTRPQQGGDQAKPPKGDADPANAPKGEGDPNAPKTDGPRPEGEGAPRPAGDGSAPRTGDGPTQVSPEEAAALARDAELGDLGYSAGTRAQGQEVAARIQEGSVPPKSKVRDTEANQRGLAELQRLRSDPSLKPEQRAKLDQEIAARVREQGEPPGNLPRDIQDARTRVQEAEAAKKGGDETPGTGRDSERPPREGETQVETPRMTGQGETRNIDPEAARLYDEIRASNSDVEAVAREMGIPPEVAQRIKDHLFQSEHDIPTADGPVRERFESVREFADAWRAAEAGTLTPEQRRFLVDLLTHENVEASLHAAGLPVYDPNVAFDADGYPQHSFGDEGAHSKSVVAERGFRPQDVDRMTPQQRADLLRPMMEATLDVRSFTPDQVAAMHPDARAVYEQIQAERAGNQGDVPPTSEHYPGTPEGGDLSGPASGSNSRMRPEDRPLVDPVAAAARQAEYDRIRSGTPGQIRGEADLSNADVAFVMNEQLGNIAPDTVDAIIARFPPDQQAHARAALARASGFGNIESLNAIRQALDAHIAAGGSLYLPGQGSLADNIHYMGNRKHNFDPVGGSARVPTTDTIGPGTIVLLDAVVLSRIQQDPAFRQSLIDNGAILLDPVGFNDGINMFNSQSPEAVAARTEALVARAEEIVAQSNGTLSFDDALTRALTENTDATLAADPNHAALGAQVRRVDPAEVPNLSSDSIAGNLNGQAGITAQDLDAVLAQIPPELQPYARELLAQQSEIYSPRRFTNELMQQHARVMQEAAARGIPPDQVYILIPEPGKSYGMLSMAHRAATGTPVNRYVTNADLAALGPDTMVVIFDDVAGSGDSLVDASAEASGYYNYQGNLVVSPMVSTRSANDRFTTGDPTTSPPTPSVVSQQPNTTWDPQQISTALTESNFFRALSPEQQANLLAVAGRLGWPPQAGNGLTMAFPYMAPDNNNHFFGTLLAQFFIANQNSGSSKSQPYTPPSSAPHPNA